MAALAVSLSLRSGAEPATAAIPASGPPRKASSEITEALLAKLPKYAPPAPALVPGIAPRTDAAGSLEEILILPKITVRPTPIVPESDFAFLNTKGRLELSLNAHPGIRVGNLLGLNDIMTLTMQQDERVAAKKADLADLVQRSTLGDSELDKKIRALTQALLQRSGTERDFPSEYLPPRESRGRPKR